MLRFTSIVVLLLLPACLVFDERLHQDSEGESDGETNADAPEVADMCIGQELPVFSESTSFSLDLSSFTSFGLGYPKCVEKQYQGPDAFFILDAKEGDRWNITATPQDVEQDVSIVVLDGDCSPSSCHSVRDRCGSGFDEEFALAAAADARYIVSIDGLDRDVGGNVSLTLSKSRCGNGEVEPGETCDGGPDCDALCRRQVAAGTVAEGEPNDIFTGVDMIGVPNEGGQVRVTGVVGGPCDEDHYAFIVPDGGSASVHMYAPGGGPCPDDTPEIELPLVDFLAAGGPVPIGAGKKDATSGGCPFFEASGEDPDFDFARNLPASEYHLVINAFETEAAIPYEIVFDIQTTTPP